MMPGGLVDLCVNLFEQSSLDFNAVNEEVMTGVIDGDHIHGIDCRPDNHVLNIVSVGEEHVCAVVWVQLELE